MINLYSMACNEVVALPPKNTPIKIETPPVLNFLNLPRPEIFYPPSTVLELF